MCYIGYPDAADLDTAGFQLLVHLIPHGFVELLSEMSAIFSSIWAMKALPSGTH